MKTTAIVREGVYVWEIPIRLAHWVIFGAILVLSFTGFYIGTPFIPGSESLNTWMRAVHRISAYALVAALAVRVYWAFAGNEWASWRAFVPYLFREGWRGIQRTFLYYTFLRREPPGSTGHNELAGIAYSAVYALLLFEVVTGFGLLSLERGGVWSTAFGWVFWFGSPQGVRLLHHLVMWLLLGFAVHHVYSSILIDIEEGNGTISSIFSGYKTRKRAE